MDQNRLAPQAGFEPATLRLTAEKRSASCRVRLVAWSCRIEHSPPWRLADFCLRSVSRCPSVCRHLLHPKGKKRATYQRIAQTSWLPAAWHSVPRRRSTRH